ncbi:MAG: shikimate kinase [Ignavibacteria bacterium]|nr:shikimate kinase [Ignavibacteria bacterium]
MQERIYLTGFMGTGKTTLGKVIANCLGWDFYDIDREIEKDIKKSVAKIVLEEGETRFRQLEKEKLASLTLVSGAVISLGGGTLIDKENIEICKTSGLLVYLKADLSVIYQRIRKKTNRPLFRSENDSEMNEDEGMKKLTALFEIRKAGYESAHITIETEADNFGKSIDKIVKRIKTGKPDKGRKS